MFKSLIWWTINLAALASTIGIVVAVFIGIVN